MRRTYVNIAAFFLLALTLIAWSVFNYVPLGILENPRLVTAEFAQSPGLRSGYEVTYLGHSVGRIDAVRLADGVSEVVLALDEDADVPADATAAARRRSAIGEPYVDLSPTPGSDASTGDRLANGDRIPVERTSSPIEYGELFRSLDVLVRSLDAEALATVVNEAAAAVDGRGEDVRRIIASAHELVTTAEANGDEIESLVHDLGTIAAVIAENRDSLGNGIESLAAVAESLSNSTDALDAVLDETPGTLTLVNRILEASDDSLVCTIDGLSVLEQVLDTDGQAAAATLLQRSALFTDIARAIRDPDDGIFNLLITVNSGEPAVVQFAEPASLPPSVSLQPCPERFLSVAPTAVASATGPGAGGQRPPSDRLDLDLAPRGPTGERATPTGTSEVEAPESSFVRLARTGLPLAAVALLVGLFWAIIASRRTEKA